MSPIDYWWWWVLTESQKDQFQRDLFAVLFGDEGQSADGEPA